MKSPHSWPSLGTHGGDSWAVVTSTHHICLAAATGGGEEEQRQTGTKGWNKYMLAPGSESRPLQNKPLRQFSNCLHDNLWLKLWATSGVSEMWLHCDHPRIRALRWDQRHRPANWEMWFQRKGTWCAGRIIGEDKAHPASHSTWKALGRWFWPPVYVYLLCRIQKFNFTQF